MISDRRIFGANRLIVAGLVALFAVSATLIFLPGATDYMAYGTFGRRLSFLNSWEPEHRLLLAYVFTGISAAAAVSSLRWLIDNTMVVVDSEGIEVRRLLSTQRAQWRDFDGIKVSKLMRSDIKLRFRPGRDAEGRRLSRKVRMPSPMYRVDTKAVLAEVLLHTSDEPRGTARAAPPAAAPVRGLQPRPMAATARPVFGKRR